MSRQFTMNEDIVTALGLPVGRVKSASVMIEAGSLPMVEAVIELDDSTSERLVDLLHTYTLVEDGVGEQLE